MAKNNKKSSKSNNNFRTNDTSGEYNGKKPKFEKLSSFDDDESFIHRWIALLHHHQTLLAGLLPFLIILISIFWKGVLSLPSSTHASIGINTVDKDRYFYAWATDPPNAREDSLMHALFPNLTQFQSAWEVHPLLSRVTFDSTTATTQQFAEKQKDILSIPAILHNRSSASNYKLDTNTKNDDKEDPIMSLFEIDNTYIILSQPMKHGHDYKLLKKIVMPPGDPNAGEEYNGMLPKSDLTIDEIMHAFHYGAFSLIINKMQLRWNPVARMAAAIEEEFGAVQVSVNLYLTPDVTERNEGSIKKNGEVREAFEAHWDWMDVIVMQISGRKRWSVAREPSIYLSGKDQKRKPSRKEVESLHHYSDFTLCPGDVLYIPRGFIHNASTVQFDKLERNGGGSNPLDFDRCPSYPKNSTSAELLSNRLNGPSLHLTFGLLQASEATIETLIHHALDAYFANTDNNAHKMVAIPAKTSCSSPVQTQMAYDLEWKSILHHVLAEVARRKHRCDRMIFNSGLAIERHGTCEGTVILRQSVPLLLLKNNNFDENSSDNGTNHRQYSNLKQSYILGLNSFSSSASIPKTMDFILNLLQPPSDGELIFHYPGYSKRDVILCPDLMTTLSERTFIQILRSFEQYAKDNFHTVLSNMNRWGKDRRNDVRKSRDLDLKMVRQE